MVALIICALIGTLNFGGHFAHASELHDAVKKENVSRVQSLLSSGANINDVDHFGTPLHSAAVRRNEKIVELLISAGADIEAETVTGKARALHLASAREKQLDMAALLIRHGARLDAYDGEGRTPLIVAVSSDNIEIVRLLLAVGADPQGLDGLYHESPLHWAAMDGKVEMAKLLLSKGANINIKAGPHGDTPLHYAAMVGRLEMVELLVKHGAAVNKRNDKGQTPLQRTRHDNVKAVLRHFGAQN
jgi:ankyrin repeat protein